MDCTYSPLVAVYFALEKLLMSPEKTSAFVWAFKQSWFRQVHALLPTEDDRAALDRVANDHSGEAFESLFLRPDPVSFVYPVSPRTLNDRLVAQQGVFLCPGDITRSFQDNLAALRDDGDGDVLRIELGRNMLRPGLELLLRMNLDSASLFPGLTGYAESLRTRLLFLVERTGA